MVALVSATLVPTPAPTAVPSAAPTAEPTESPTDVDANPATLLSWQNASIGTGVALALVLAWIVHHRRTRKREDAALVAGTIARQNTINALRWEDENGEAPATRQRPQLGGGPPKDGGGGGGGGGAGGVPTGQGFAARATQFAGGARDTLRGASAADLWGAAARKSNLRKKGLGAGESTFDVVGDALGDVLGAAKVRAHASGQRRRLKLRSAARLLGSGLTLSTCA